MTDYNRNSLSGDNAAVNPELEKIQKALETKLDRIPSAGKDNAMKSVLDMNSHRIINLPAPVDGTDPARLEDVRDTLGITGDNTVTKQTFAELQAYKSPESFNYYQCIERGNAFYVLQDEGYVAQTGDLGFDNGRVAKLTILDAVRPEFYGIITGDSTDKIQAAIDRAIQESDGVVKLSRKAYYYTTLEIDGAVSIVGCGSSTDGTLLLTLDATSDKITVTASGQVVFKDIYLGSIGSITQTGGYYIKYNASSGTNFSPVLENLTFAKPYGGVAFLTSALISMKNCYVANCISTGVYLENTVNNDAGDHCFVGNTFDAGSETNTIHILQKNSGGLRLTSNKFLAGAYHYVLEAARTGAGATDTSVLCITGNSFENATLACIRLTAISPSVFSLIDITGNEIKTANGPNCRAIQIPNNTYDAIKNGNISGNVIIHNGTNGIGLDIQRASGFSIGTNFFVTNSVSGTVGVLLGANASDISIERQHFVNAATEYSINASATNIRLNEPEYDLGNHVSAVCSNAVGNVYESPVTSVSFNKTHPVAPRVHTQLVASGSSTFGVAVSNVTTTGFDFKATGAQLNDAVTLLWHTSLD